MTLYAFRITTIMRCLFSKVNDICIYFFTKRKMDTRSIFLYISKAPTVWLKTISILCILEDRRPRHALLTSVYYNFCVLNHQIQLQIHSRQTLGEHF